MRPLYNMGIRTYICIMYKFIIYVSTYVCTNEMILLATLYIVYIVYIYMYGGNGSMSPPPQKKKNTCMQKIIICRGQVGWGGYGLPPPTQYIKGIRSEDERKKKVGDENCN